MSIWIIMIGITLFIWGIFRYIYVVGGGFGAAGPGLHTIYRMRLRTYYGWLPFLLFIVFASKLYWLLVIVWIPYERLNRKYRNDLIKWGYNLCDEKMRKLMNNSKKSKK